MSATQAAPLVGIAVLATIGGQPQSLAAFTELVLLQPADVAIAHVRKTVPNWPLYRHFFAARNSTLVGAWGLRCVRGTVYAVIQVSPRPSEDPCLPCTIDEGRPPAQPIQHAAQG